MSRSFALLVPVKSLDRAKSRLGGRAAVHRAPLMGAFARDVITAALHTPSVASVHVITDEQGLDLEGVEILPDEGRGSLNRALSRAAATVLRDHPDVGVAAICADIPSLLPADLDLALQGDRSGRWFVADQAGTGTTLLVAGPGEPLTPSFGPDSARLHAESGAVPLTEALVTLRHDVDTEQDLDAAVVLGVGAYTRAVLTR